MGRDIRSRIAAAERAVVDAARADALMSVTCISVEHDDEHRGPGCYRSSLHADVVYATEEQRVALLAELLRGHEGHPPLVLIPRYDPVPPPEDWAALTEQR